MTNYKEDYSHAHCWNQETPACGIPKEKHLRCCLCEKRNVAPETTMTLKELLKRQDKQFDDIEITYPNGITEPLLLNEEQERAIKDFRLQERQEIIEWIKTRIRERVYAWDEHEDSGSVDWKDILEILNPNQK